LNDNEKFKIRASEHTDYGSLTLLFQKKNKGLQIKHENKWIDVLPLENSIVVNSGDLLSRWSNDIIKSNIHRVITFNETKNLDRYSIAYFM
jgi:isopenicillin N synthase-like dioxygenase